MMLVLARIDTVTNPFPALATLRPPAAMQGKSGANLVNEQ
jgi:hypothetical protein